MLITKLIVPESIHAYREAKKRDKAIIELATRANDPRIRAAIVTLLNEYQRHVRQAQEKPENQELISKIRDHDTRTKDLRELAKDARVVRDTIDLGTNNILEGKRRRQAPERYETIAWTAEGSRLKVKGPKKNGLLAKARSKFAKGAASLKKKGKSATSRAKTIGSVKGKGKGKAKESDVEDDSEPSLDDNDSDYENYTEAESASQAGDEESDAEDDTVKAKLRRARALFRSENQLGEQEKVLKLLLSLPKDKVYDEKDLEDEATMVRGLELLYAHRIGMSTAKVPSIHIKVRGSQKYFSTRQLTFFTVYPPRRQRCQGSRGEDSLQGKRTCEFDSHFRGFSQRQRP